MRSQILFLLLNLWVLNLYAHDVPQFTNSELITYGTEGLLSRRGELTPPKEIYDMEEMNRVLFTEIQSQNHELKRAKYYLINGDIRLARLYLSKLAYTQTKLRPVIYRYLAILSFMDNNFEKTYEYLSLPELQNIPHFAKICVLKVLSQIVLSKTQTLEETWGRCQLENERHLNPANLVWLDTLIKLKVQPRPGVTKAPFQRFKLRAYTIEEAKIMMKLAIYLNQEELLKDQIPELTIEFLRDPEIRELAGQIYFRTGMFAKSYRFIEDLKSPNSENIKGNLYVLRNKYELAYAQFKLALEQKQNSQNALERLLPIAWLLGDWEDGSKYAEQITPLASTKVNKLALLSAFLVQKGDHEKAESTLNYIANRTRRGTRLEITQLASFNFLMQNKPDLVKKQAKLSCDQYDIVNCWVLFQLVQWDAFPIMIRREEKISENRDWEKLVAEEINEPLKETVFVNQLDIEELDDKLINLIPKSP